ncbi:MAG: hypothetical protein OXI96_03755, partial [Acidimicrobiaceae bacterium]|nr:hypothetical protein [Acidimicrobiaceae bacterium]
TTTALYAGGGRARTRHCHGSAVRVRGRQRDAALYADHGRLCGLPAFPSPHSQPRRRRVRAWTSPHERYRIVLADVGTRVLPRVCTIG